MTQSPYQELILSGGSEADFNLRFEKALLDYRARCKRQGTTSMAQCHGNLPLPPSPPWPMTNGAIVSRSKSKIIYPSGSSEDTDGEQPWLGEKPGLLPESKRPWIPRPRNGLICSKTTCMAVEHIVGSTIWSILFLGDEPLRAMEAMHPICGNIFLNKTAWQFRCGFGTGYAITSRRISTRLRGSCTT